MTLPRSKVFVEPMSAARKRFHDSDDVRSYHAVAQMLKDREGALPHVRMVGRGTYIQVCALWEAYCEHLVHEASHVLIRRIEDPSQLPPSLTRQIARELRADKHELSAWKLAGEGWKEVARERVRLTARQTVYCSPRPKRVDALFQKAIGLENLSSRWLSPSDEEDVRQTLERCIDIRNAIAHGAGRGVVVTKPVLSKFYLTTRDLVIQTDEIVAAYVREQTGDDPW